MGNKAGKAALKSKEKEVARLAAATGFTADEIHTLFTQFLSLKGAVDSTTDTLTMNKGEFQAALGFKGSERSVFLDRIFDIFDKNADGEITFEEFLLGIALLKPDAKVEEKLKFTFLIYDISKAGRISGTDLKAMLSATLRENDVVLSDSAIDRMVADTFKQYDRNADGYIDFGEYRDMCLVNPAILKPLTINVSEMIAQAREEGDAAAAAAAGGK